MALLRSPNGCPWDREQTHDSIKGHLVEEAFEVVDALDNGDFEELEEELGDLLLQVVFHARLAEEAGRFSIGDVISGITAKLKRRHPHIFGDVEVSGSEEVLNNWERIKAREKERPSFLSGVPHSMPALALSQKLQEKAARVGFDWPDDEGVLEKLEEEILELRETEPRSERRAEEFGDILFTLVNFGRHMGIDSELALRSVSQKFRARFARMEELARERGTDFAKLPLVEQEGLWTKAKEDENDDDRGRRGQRDT